MHATPPMKLIIAGWICPASAYHNYQTIYIANSFTGTITDLLAVFNTAQARCRAEGLYPAQKHQTCTIRYFTSRERKTLEEFQADLIKTLSGYYSVEFSAQDTSYSEFTPEMTYNTDCTVGGHDLLAELQSKQNYWLHMELEFNERPSQQPH